MSRASRIPYNSFVQMLCPSPRRHLQRLVLDHGLKTGLDIGCGETSILTSLRCDDFRSTGIDVFQGMIESAEKRNLHDEYIHGDFRKVQLDYKFDVVVLSHLIEHFTKEDGFAVLDRVEALADCLVYIETPRGFREQPALDGNEFQKHLSGWLPDDFRSRGYTVYGSGLRGLRGVAGVSRIFPEMITRLLERIFQRFVFRQPNLAGTISAILIFDKDGKRRCPGGTDE